MPVNYSDTNDIALYSSMYIYSIYEYLEICINSAITYNISLLPLISFKIFILTAPSSFIFRDKITILISKDYKIIIAGTSKVLNYPLSSLVFVLWTIDVYISLR